MTKNGEGERDPRLIAIAERLKQASKRFGRGADSAAAAEISLPTWERYLNGRVEPYFLPIACFAAAAGVSLDWVAYGRIVQAINDRRLIDAIAAVEARLEKARKKLDPEDKAILIVDLYTGAVSDVDGDRIDHDVADRRLERLIRLVK